MNQRYFDCAMKEIERLASTHSVVGVRSAIKKTRRLNLEIKTFIADKEGKDMAWLKNQLNRM